ncbi:hypothetical protein Tco_1194336 [Tanacetum coccineum]
MQILSVIRIKAYSRYGYDYLSKIVLRIANFQEHMIAKKDFKNLYPSDFEDVNLLLLQGHLDHLPGRSSQDLEVQVKMEMEIPRSSIFYFITTCSYSTVTSKELMKAQVYVSKLLQL